MKVMFQQSETKDLTTITIVSPTPLSNYTLYSILVDLANQFKGVVIDEPTEQVRVTCLPDSVRDANETGDQT